MVPIKKVEDLINKHSNLEKELSSGNVDKKLFAKKSKEYSDLNEIIKEAKDYISFEKNKNDLEKIINDSSSDKEIKEIAYIELQEIIKKHKNNEKK
jgi:peptide chain release factor 1